MKKIISLAIVLTALLAVSCSDDDKTSDLALETGGVELLEDMAPAFVLITGGSGKYEVELGDNSVAEASLISGEAYGKYGAIQLKGKKIGSTVLTVTDLVLDQNTELNVRVREAGMFLNFRDLQITSETDGGEQLEKKIDSAVVADLPFRDGGYMYILSREEKGLMYAYLNTVFMEERYFRHIRNDEGVVYLEISTDSSWEDDEVVRRLEVIDDQSVFTGYYSGFFGYSTAGTRSDIVVSPQVYYREDLTAKMKERFQDEEGGITTVTAVYAMRLNFVIFIEETSPNR